MDWKIEFDKYALKELKKLDKNTQREIIIYLEEKVLKSSSPRIHGKALVGDKIGLWRYRVGKYRIICNIYDEKLIVLVLKIAKRDKVYN